MKDPITAQHREFDETDCRLLPKPLSFRSHYRFVVLFDIIPEASLDSELGSSVSIVSGYGLDDRPIEVPCPAEAKGFLSLSSVSRPALGPTQPPV
jgi:hypothetical protein